MTTSNERRPGWRAEASGMSAGERRFHVQNATAEPLLQRLDRVRKCGAGWVARCPAHEDGTASLSITETPDKVLVWCFAACRTDDVLAAVGLSFADLFPPRHWPESPAERRVARKAAREAGWGAALAVLAMEATVVLIAGRQLAGWQALSAADDARLAEAVGRIDHAKQLLTEAARWQPQVSA